MTYYDGIMSLSLKFIINIIFIMYQLHYIIKKLLWLLCLYITIYICKILLKITVLNAFCCCLVDFSWFSPWVFSFHACRHVHFLYMLNFRTNHFTLKRDGCSKGLRYLLPLLIYYLKFKGQCYRIIFVGSMIFICSCLFSDFNCYKIRWFCLL